MPRLLHIGLPQFVDLSPGADLVLQPPEKLRCWGLVPAKSHSNGAARPRRCDCCARNGRLTCHNHRSLEDAVQRLMSTTEAQKESA